MELEFETRTTDYLRQSIEDVCRQEQTLEVIGSGRLAGRGACGLLRSAGGRAEP